MRFVCPCCAAAFRLPPDRLGIGGRGRVTSPSCAALSAGDSRGGPAGLTITALPRPEPEPAATRAFFETGETFTGEETAGPADFDARKPTASEYRELLQEFSVMFRLDKRTKRQRGLLIGLGAGLAAGVVAFGASMWLHGERRV